MTTFSAGKNYKVDILEECYNKAKTIIVEHKDKMVSLVEKLIEVETMDRPVFEQLMNA